MTWLRWLWRSPKESSLFWGALMQWRIPSQIGGRDLLALLSFLWYGCLLTVSWMSGDISIRTTENILVIQRHISHYPGLTLCLLKGQEWACLTQSNISPEWSLITLLYPSIFIWESSGVSRHWRMAVNWLQEEYVKIALFHNYYSLLLGREWCQLIPIALMGGL